MTMRARARRSGPAPSNDVARMGVPGERLAHVTAPLAHSPASTTATARDPEPNRDDWSYPAA